MCVCRGGGYSDIGHILRFKILNFNIFGGFQKMNIFWGMKILWIFFFWSSQNWNSFRVYFYAFKGLFLR